MIESQVDPMEPDYDALAGEEPVTQNGDSRDSAEVAGAQ